MQPSKLCCSLEGSAPIPCRWKVRCPPGREHAPSTAFPFPNPPEITLFVLSSRARHLSALPLSPFHHLPSPCPRPLCAATWPALQLLPACLPRDGQHRCQRGALRVTALSVVRASRPLFLPVAGRLSAQARSSLERAQHMGTGCCHRRRSQVSESPGKLPWGALQPTALPWLCAAPLQAPLIPRRLQGGNQGRCKANSNGTASSEPPASRPTSREPTHSPLGLM